MSDDLSKVVFGEPIECRGQKPDGFPTGRVPVQWSYNGRPYLDVTAEQCKNFGLPDQPVLIRLPVDVADPKGLISSETLPSDDIAKRMEAFVRRAAVDLDHEQGPVECALQMEARSIVALLHEPIDPNLLECRKIGAEISKKHSALHQIMRPQSWEDGDNDDSHKMELMLAAIRRGRALERDSREG